jgi:hypothetical protein
VLLKHMRKILRVDAVTLIRDGDQRTIAVLV